MPEPKHPAKPDLISRTGLDDAVARLLSEMMSEGRPWEGWLPEARRIVDAVLPRIETVCEWGPAHGVYLDEDDREPVDPWLRGDDG